MPKEDNFFLLLLLPIMNSDVLSDPPIHRSLFFPILQLQSRGPFLSRLPKRSRCAYRSLQTTISWFRLQQYSSSKVPSHREIQQALVEIGDKDLDCVGSHEWIGTIELSFVLDKLLGVSCKIINVRSGSELPEKCRELAIHFETQGTPATTGGGVLAYSLLGVDYNEVEWGLRLSHP